jgi:hypothetical protein
MTDTEPLDLEALYSRWHSDSLEREDVPALIAEVRRLREAMLAARDACLEEYECASQAATLEEALGIHA